MKTTWLRSLQSYFCENPLGHPKSARPETLRGITTVSPQPSTENEAVREHLRLIIRLSEILELLPAQLVAHDYNHETFGSWSVLIRRGGAWFNITFDGKDRILLIWKTVPPGEPRTAPRRYLSERRFEIGLMLSNIDVIARLVAEATAPPSNY
jgi:hypothetical protein